jgi:enoyl-CoA hydratase/carnithine racemase
MIGLDRVAKRNAFDLDLLNELSLAYGEFEATRRSAGGGGLRSWRALYRRAGPGQCQRRWPKAGRHRRRCDPWGVFAGPRVNKPVIVAAQGYCLTIGIELMLAADINLCASNTRFAQMEVQRGFSLWRRDPALSSGRRLGQRDALAADRR